MPVRIATVLLFFAVAAKICISGEVTSRLISDEKGMVTVHCLETSGVEVGKNHEIMYVVKDQDAQILVALHLVQNKETMAYELRSLSSCAPLGVHNWESILTPHGKELYLSIHQGHGIVGGMCVKLLTGSAEAYVTVQGEVIPEKPWPLLALQPNEEVVRGQHPEGDKRTKGTGPEGNENSCQKLRGQPPEGSKSFSRHYLEKGG